jgi:hypothetical protein
MLKLCTIHLAFDRGYFEVVLIENTPKTLVASSKTMSPQPLCILRCVLRSITTVPLLVYRSPYIVWINC